MAYYQGKVTGSKINASKNDTDERKIFVGGLSWESSIDDLKTYFSRYGEVLDSNIKIDLNTGLSRGFGFVLFKDASSVEKVCLDKSHILGGKQIDPKPAVAGGAGPGFSKDPPCKKIFVGGLDTDLTQEEIAEHFSQYGKVDLVELPYDKIKNQRRAFGFITFESEDIVEKLCQNAKVPFRDRSFDIRKALTREQQESLAMRMSRGGGPMRAGYRGRGRGGGGGGGGGGGAYMSYDYNGMYGNPFFDYYGGYYGGYGAPGAHAYEHASASVGSYGDTGYASASKARKSTWQTEQAASYHPYNR